jgi:stage II sporulation protein D
MKKRTYRINRIKLLLMLALLLVLLVALFVLVRAILMPDRAADQKPDATQEPIYTPAPTLIDLYAYFDWTETTENIRVDDHRADKLVTMSLEEYIVGVVSAEMPAYYDFEALKAQAVASRTYTLYSMAHGGCHTNPDADVCTNSKCCQAFSTHERMQKTWGNDYANNYNRIAQAVMHTAGEVLTYKGKICDALYHACSGGQTEDSENVYSNALPYLRGVDSPYEDPMRTEDVEIGFDAFLALITEKYPGCGVTEDNAEDEVRIAETYESGRVKTLRLGKTEITGKEARSLFNLRSTMFTITWAEDGIVFHTKGYGHGVGLSQNGANGLAKRGASYEEILHQYYTGVTIGTIRADGTIDFPRETPGSTAAPLVPEGSE